MNNYVQMLHKMLMKSIVNLKRKWYMKMILTLPVKILKKFLPMQVNWWIKSMKCRVTSWNLRSKKLISRKIWCPKRSINKKSMIYRELFSRKIRRLQISKANWMICRRAWSICWMICIKVSRITTLSLVFSWNNKEASASLHTGA